MSDKTGIEWTEATWNPVTGCSKVSQGCKNCYALRDWPRLAAHKGTVYSGRAFTDVQYHMERLEQPLRWRRPRRIFVNSMSDLFHEKVTDTAIADIFGVMAAARQHTFQVLTKRPERMRELLAQDAFVEAVDNCAALYSHAEVEWPLPNVWLGTSVEDQATMRERVPFLQHTPAAVRWLSAEPLLGEIDFEGLWVPYSDPRIHKNWLETLDWVVVGGESGPNARPMNQEWARLLRDECAALGTPFFFKQWGEWAPGSGPAGERVRRETLSGGAIVWRAGKKEAGRLLDGREHNEYPRGVA